MNQHQRGRIEYVRSGSATLLSDWLMKFAVAELESMNSCAGGGEDLEWRRTKQRSRRCDLLYSSSRALSTTNSGHQTNTMHRLVPYVIYITVKGKAILLQAWTGPEGSRRLKLPDCKTIDT